MERDRLGFRQVLIVGPEGYPDRILAVEERGDVHDKRFFSPQPLELVPLLLNVHRRFAAQAPPLRHGESLPCVRLGALRGAGRIAVSAASRDLAKCQLALPRWCPLDPR